MVFINIESIGYHSSNSGAFEDPRQGKQQFQQTAKKQKKTQIKRQV